jgi:type I restriction enzyme S subunit
MGQSPPSESYSSNPEDGLPFLQGTADFGPIYPLPRVYCASPPKIAEKGDILFSVRAPVGELNIADQRTGIGRGLCAVRASGGLLPRFAWWALHESRGQLNYVSTGSTYEAVAAEDVGNVLVATAPPDKQRAIADYLDRETARLDALIAAKERLLGLLAEKRQALITRAVTRGLDPNAPLRDSGIPWLGPIPAHWKVERLKFHLRGLEQGWSPQCENLPAEDGEWGVMKAGCVNGWIFDPTENKRLPNTEAPLAEYEIRCGDVLMSRANTTELLGSAALVTEVRPRLLLCDKLYRLDVDDSALKKAFLVAFLRSRPGRYAFEREATGASNSMQNIGQDTVRNLWVPIPPLDEQSTLLRNIQFETQRLDALNAATERTIALLKERRSALIAAAVTGQIPIPPEPVP